MADRNWLGIRRRPQPQLRPTREIRSLVAAAGPVPVNTRSNASQATWGGSEWQREAWVHYDTCPELHSAGTIIANSLSRVQLIAVDVDPVTGRPSAEATDNQAAAQIVARLFGGPTGQSQAMAQYGLHLTVPGDYWTLATDDPTGGPMRWDIISTLNVHSTGTQVEVVRADNSRYVVTDTDMFFPVRRSHPHSPWLADSAVRALLPVLRELAAVSAAISAMLQSRLIMNGLLVIPDEADPPSLSEDAEGVGGPEDEDWHSQPGDSKAQLWAEVLTSVAAANLSQPGSAAAALPVVATMAKDVIDSMKQFDFGHDVDGALDELRQSAVKRIAIGLDMPPEVLLGLGDSTHWNAWQVSESYVKTYIAPLLELISDAITSFYLQPALRANGLDPARYAVGFDLNDLLPEQLDFTNASVLHERGVISDRALVIAGGFDPDRDAPTDDERIRRFLLEIGRTNPDTLKELVPALKSAYPGIQIDTSVVPVADAGRPSLPVASPPQATS